MWRRCARCAEPALDRPADRAPLPRPGRAPPRRPRTAPRRRHAAARLPPADRHLRGPRARPAATDGSQLVSRGCDSRGASRRSGSTLARLSPSSSRSLIADLRRRPGPRAGSRRRPRPLAEAFAIKVEPEDTEVEARHRPARSSPASTSACPADVQCSTASADGEVQPSADVQEPRRPGVRRAAAVGGPRHELRRPLRRRSDPLVSRSASSTSPTSSRPTRS